MTPAPTVRYCDGESLRSLEVELHLTGDGRLRILGENLERFISLAEIRVSGRLGRVPQFLRLPDGAVIETPGHDALDAALAAARPVSRFGEWIHRLESRAHIAALATLILVATTGLTLWQGLPRLAQRAAYSVPVTLESEAGRTGYAVFAQAFNPSALDLQQQERVNRQLDRLKVARPLHVEPKLSFLRMQSANAFALPGGIIIMTDELLQLAEDDDEIAAVLAHEIGHIELRHGLQSILRSSSALIVVSMLTGDLSTLSTFSGTLPFLLLQHGYAREFEHEADAFAAKLLSDAGIDPTALPRILRRLEASRPKQGADFSYLSTHPATEERVRKLQGAGGQTSKH